MDPDVAAYVLDNEAARSFFFHFEPFLLSYLRMHQDSGREDIRLAIGCTGGKHRSVAVVERLKRYLNQQAVEAAIFHRDVERE